VRLLYWLRHRYWLAVSASYRAHVRDVDAMGDPNGIRLVGGQVVFDVHPETVCAGHACCIHNPSDHHMAGWSQHWRSDRSLMERICPHGIGHPDPDHVGYLRSLALPGLAQGVELDLMIVHGCDGCCRPPRYSLDSVAAELGVDLHD
jgi:hypothetical protein